MERSLSGIPVVAMLALLPLVALAQPKADPQQYPSRPIRIILPNTAGSAMDVVTRMMSQRFTEAWGQQVVVDNRPGAGGMIGLEIAAKAPADGYTLVFSSSAGLVIQPLLTKVPYDSHRDFAPIECLPDDCLLKDYPVDLPWKDGVPAMALQTSMEEIAPDRKAA